jgi:3-deoxy-manno-octulosonate cytidylyltransferase (CMP-KDO synthetase)
LKAATVVIPARYQSSRFPGKLLVSVGGKPLVQRVVEGVRQAKLVERIIIATDDSRIQSAAAGFAAEAVLTSSAHRCGTDRVAEVAEGLRTPLIINVQGDEPLLSGEMIDSLVESLQDHSVLMASLMAKVFDLNLVHEPNIVKVAVDQQGNALYFSRSPLPYQVSDFFYQHIGVYGFQREFLLRFARMKPSRLEQIEKLEQLRALENGFKIRMIEVRVPTLSVDTPQDIIEVEKLLKIKNHD